jgi:hypothetical protein
MALESKGTERSDKDSEFSLKATCYLTLWYIVPKRKKLA